MASLQSEVMQQATEMPLLLPSTVALLYVKIQSLNELVEKIIITVSLKANWAVTYQGKQVAVENIKAEIKYPDSKGVPTIKNTGIPIQDKQDKSLYPLIWNEQHSNRAFQTTFIKNSLEEIGVQYHVQFRLSENLPQALQKSFTEEKKLSIKAKSEQAYFININLS